MSAVQTILAKAQENLKAARLCHREKLYNATANRTYYACAQAAWASLIQHGKAPREPNHDKVHLAFLKHYNHTFPKLPKILSKLRTHRETADYEERNIYPREALDCLSEAGDFVSQLLQTLHRK